ncbi:MAG: glycosyltransferase [Chloroflexota bacterium]
MGERKKLKVLEVSPVYYPTLYPGGVPLVVQELCKRLVEKGHDVTVYTTDLSDGHSRLPSGFKEHSGVKVHYFRNISDSLAFRRKIFTPLSMYPVAKAQVAGFDIIHCHEYRTLLNVFIHRLAKRHGVPYVLQPHGSAQLVEKAGLKRVFDMVTGYRILNGTSKFIAITQHERRQIANMGVADDKIVVLPNAIDMGQFSSLPEKLTFKRQYGIRTEEKMVLYVGRVHAGKGLDLLIRAFGSLARENKDVRLVIVGPDDGYLAIAKKLAQDCGVAERTLFTGYKGGVDKLAAYVDADVFFSHSSHGSMLLTYLEAWACRVPVIAIDQVDMVLPREKVHDVAGYIVPYDSEQLARAMTNIITHRDLKRRFGENGRKIAEAWRGWSTWGDLVEDQYYQTLEIQDKRQPTTPVNVRVKTRTAVKASVICTVKNEAGSMGRLLDSLAAQSRPVEELVIVDGGSTDGTPDVIKGYAGCLPINLIVAPGANISRGRNIAIENAKFDYIACTDGGCVADSDWLKNIVAPFEADESVEVVSGSYQLEANNTFQECLREITYLKLKDDNRATYLPSSRSLALKKECWRKVGGYPEWLYMGEDTAFHVNLKNAGFKFALARNAIVHWEPMSDMAHLFKQYSSYVTGDTMAGTTSQVGSLRYMLLYFTFIVRATLTLVARGRLSAPYYGPLVGAVQLAALVNGRRRGLKRTNKSREISPVA